MKNYTAKINHKDIARMIFAFITAILVVGGATSALASPGRFEFDRAAYISQYDLFFYRPVLNPNLGVPVGNGDIGVLQWGNPDEVYFGINKADVWDRRYEEKKQEILVDPKTLMMLKERAPETFKTLMHESRNATQKNRFPTPKRCGGLVIRTPGAKEYIKYEDRLCYHSATIDSNYDTAVDKRTMHSFAYKDENLLVVKIKFDSDKPIEREFEIFRSPDEARDIFENKLTGIEDAVGFVDGKDFGIEQHFPHHEKFPEDFHFVLRGRILGADYRPEANKWRAWTTLPARQAGEITVLVAVVSSRDNANPKQAAKEILDRAEKKGLEAVEEHHRRLWDEYWQKCMIDLPDQILEQNWYSQVYLMGCTTRPGRYLPGICGVWYWSDFAPWNGDYHTDQNIEMQHWGTFSSNHPELALPFCEMFYKMLPLAQQQAREHYGIQGARYSLATHEYNGNLAGHPYFDELSNGPWIAFVFWWYYDYTRDEDFLRNRAYPVMKEVLQFFADYVKKDEQGRYYIWPSVPSECSIYTKNPIADLACLRRLCEITIKASKILAADKHQRKQWRDLMENLSSLPQEDGVFKLAETLKPHRHTACAMVQNGVFPAELIGLENRGHLFDTAIRTLDSQWKPLKEEPRVQLLERFGHAWGWYIVIAARLGLADRAQEFAGKAVECFMIENGLPTTFDSYVADSPLMDIMGNYPLGINEMLMQSYTGKIRVFPATPRSWADVRFHQLRAAGAYLVTSEKRDGQVAYIVIESLKGTPCRVQNPWPGEKVFVRDTKKNKTVLKSSKDELFFKTRPGRTYLIERALKLANSYPVLTPEIVPPSGPRMISEGKYFGRRARQKGRPIAGCEKGKIINLEAMLDGRVYNPNSCHYDKPAAACSDFISEQQYTAWFGIEFDQPKEIRALKAFPAEIMLIYRAFPALQNLAQDYVLEYWDGSQWKHIPGTNVVNNDDFPVMHKFNPVLTTKIRLVITKVAESVDGRGKPAGKFRPSMQEMEVNF